MGLLSATCPGDPPWDATHELGPGWFLGPGAQQGMGASPGSVHTALRKSTEHRKRKGRHCPQTQHPQSTAPSLVPVPLLCGERALHCATTRSQTFPCCPLQRPPDPGHFQLLDLPSWRLEQPAGCFCTRGGGGVDVPPPRGPQLKGCSCGYRPGGQPRVCESALGLQWGLEAWGSAGF